jgi:hypothetical protein
MEERGYSPSQIAAAVRASEADTRDLLSQYVDATAELEGPARAEPAVRIQGQPVVQPPPQEAESEAATIARLGIPSDRTALRAFATSIPKVRQVAALIPPQYGKYMPRDGTTLKNAVAQLILLIRKVAPNY